jgi:magnesium-transporting ATPase (P-type)
MNFIRSLTKLLSAKLLFRNYNLNLCENKAEFIGANLPSGFVLLINAGNTLRRSRASHLLDRSVLFRAFGLFGPLESVVAMAAFLTTYAAAGWHFGGSFPSGNVFFRASGAAFAAVVFGQMATALACRSTTRWVGRLGWSSNSLLLFAISVEFLALIGFLTFAPVARMLGQSVPTVAGLVVAMMAAPVILIADFIHKSQRNRGGVSTIMAK